MSVSLKVKSIMYRNKLDVMCLGNIKEAALYFDRVIPLRCDSFRHNEDGPYFTTPEPLPTKYANSLIFGEEDLNWKTIMEFMTKQWAEFATSLCKDFPNQIKGFDTDIYEELYRANITGQSGRSFRSYFTDFAKSVGIQKPNILLNGQDENCSFESSFIEVALVGTSLVDSSKAHWDQIYEARKDVTSQKALRNLRLFVYDNYAGKCSHFIQDDIAKRIDLYHSASEKHGFDLITSSISALLDAKTIQSSIAAGLATGLWAGTDVGIGVACAVELGKSSLEISKKLYPMRSYKANHELAFIIDTGDRFGS